jgi:hypothetical protein
MSMVVRFFSWYAVVTQTTRASARTSKLTLVCVLAAAVPGGRRSAGPSTTLNLMGHSQGCGVCPPRALRIC